MNIEQRFCTKYCAKMFGCLGLIFVIFISLVGISLGVHLLESHLPRIIELLGFLREYLSSNIFFSCYFSPPSGTLLMRPGGLLDGVLQASESLCTFFPVSAPNTGLPVLTYPPVLQAQISPWAPLVKFPFMLLYFSIPDFFIWFYLWFISLCQYSLFGETCFILFYYNLLDILSFTSLKIFVIAYWKLSSTLSGEYSIDCFPTQHPPPAMCTWCIFLFFACLICFCCWKLTGLIIHCTNSGFGSFLQGLSCLAGTLCVVLFCFWVDSVVSVLPSVYCCWVYCWIFF